MTERGRIPLIGLTGAVAAGKSEALAAFARLGAATLSADAVVHDLLASERVRDLLAARWGESVLTDGEVDRAKVGAKVFNDPEELEWLERTLHPLVREETAAWLAGLDPETPLAVLEVPLLFETGMEGMFDATVAVTADETRRVERAGARGTEELEARMARQLSQEEKAARATYVVENDGTVEELERELAALIPGLRASAVVGERR